MEKCSYNIKKAILWLCTAHFVCDVYTGFLNPIMPFIAELLNFTVGIATIIISIAHICSSMLQPLFGFFADNMLKRFFIFWGLILVSVFIPLTPVAPNIYLLVVCMILGSLGGSFFHPQSIGFVTNFSKSKNCTDNMGIYMSLGSIGFAFGPLIAAFITQILGLDKICWTSLLGLTLAFSMFCFIPKLSLSQKLPEHKEFIQSFKDILGSRQMNLLMLISMMKSLITNGSCILLPFLWKSMGYSAFYIGFALFLFVFAGGIGSLISPYIEKHAGSKTVIYISMLGTFHMMLLFGLIYKEHQVLSIALFTLMGFTTMLAQPVTMVWAQKLLPKYKSIVAGFINGFCWGIVALCLSVVGMFAQNFGIMKVLVVLSVIPAACSYFVKYLERIRTD